VTIRSGSETAAKELRVFGFGWKEDRERKSEKIAYERELSGVPAGCSCSKEKEKTFLTRNNFKNIKK